MIWLLPYFLSAVCISGDGTINPPRLFGPFESVREAQVVMSFLAYGLLCDTGPPERHWRWTEATPVTLPLILAGTAGADDKKLTKKEAFALSLAYRAGSLWQQCDYPRAARELESPPYKEYRSWATYQRELLHEMCLSWYALQQPKHHGIILSHGAPNF